MKSEEILRALEKARLEKQIAKSGFQIGDLVKTKSGHVGVITEIVPSSKYAWKHFFCSIDGRLTENNNNLELVHRGRSFR